MMLPPVEIKKILYSTDLSESSIHAFAYAVAFANRFNAEITILHVLTEGDGMENALLSYIGQDRWQAILDRNAQDAREALIGKKRDNVQIRYCLEEFCEVYSESLGESEGVPMDEILVLRGNPVEEILKAATERNTDLIVMGTHGRGIIADALTGSTARRVIRKSKIPVLVVRLPDEE